MTQKTRPDIAEWLRSLGNVPLDRIVMDPLPGTADERDLLRLVERDRRLVELIDGTLVEKPVGHQESVIAMWLGRALGNFIYPRRLDYLTGEAGTLRMKAGSVRLPDLTFVSIDDTPGGVVPDEPIPFAPDAGGRGHQRVEHSRRDAPQDERILRLRRASRVAGLSEDEDGSRVRKRLGRTGTCPHGSGHAGRRAGAA